MKQKIFILFMFIVSFVFSSCTMSVGTDYLIKLYDENDKQIVDFDRMDEFNLMVIDNSDFKSYSSDVGISLHKAESESGNDPYYMVSFHLGGTWRRSVVKKRLKTFDEASKFIKIRIEDTRGEYKTQETSPLIDYKRADWLPEIKIKLEKK